MKQKIYTSKKLFALFIVVTCIASTINSYANLQPPSTSQASFTSTNTCYGFPAIFGNTSNEGSLIAIPDYLWDFGDGSFSTDKFPVHNYASPGTYVVILVLIMDDGLGNVESTSYTDAIIIYPNTIAAPTAINGPAAACKNQTGIQYCVDPVPDATGYVWTVPTGVNITSTTDQNCITVDFTSSFAGGDICAKATNLCNIGTFTCLKVPLLTVKPATPSTINGSTDICQGSTQFYSIAAVPNATSYTWSTTGGFNVVSGQGTTTVEVSAPLGVTSGDIRVKAVNCIGASSDRSKNIKGKTLPPPPNSLQGSTNACVNKAITYKIQGTSAGTTYVWDVTGLTAMVNNLNENKDAKITFLAPGTALVKAYSINVCGLTGPTTKTVTVTNCNRVIDAAAATQISVYPNPAKDLLNVKFQSGQNQSYTIKLMDMTGRVVYTASNSAIEGENKSEINLSGFASGIYMLTLLSNESNQQIRVMVE